MNSLAAYLRALQVSIFIHFSYPQIYRKVVHVTMMLLDFFVTGAIAIWAGLSAIGYVANKANGVMQAPQTAA